MFETRSELFEEFLGGLPEDQQRDFLHAMQRFGIQARDDDTLWKVCLALRWNVLLLEQLPDTIRAASSELDVNTVEHWAQQVVNSVEAQSRAGAWRYVIGFGAVLVFCTLITVASIGGWMWFHLERHYADQLELHLAQLAATWATKPEVVAWVQEVQDVALTPSVKRRLRFVLQHGTEVDWWMSDQAGALIEIHHAYRGTALNEAVPYPCLGADYRQWEFDNQRLTTCVVALKD